MKSATAVVAESRKKKRPAYRGVSISGKKEPLYIIEFSDRVTRVTSYQSCVWVRDGSIYGKQEHPV